MKFQFFIDVYKKRSNTDDLHKIINKIKIYDLE